MPSALTLTALLLMEEGGGGGLLERGGTYQKFHPLDGGLIREGCLLVKLLR